MFKLDLSKTYKWPVKFSVIDEKGSQRQHEIKIVFKRLSREELISLNQADFKPADDKPDAIMDADIDYLCQFVDGWEGVEIGGDTEFSRDNLRALLNGVPNINSAINSAFWESANGGQVRKN